MGTAMGQSKSGLTVSEMLDQAVIDIENRGHTKGDAIKQVAEFFGMSPTLVKHNVLYGEDRGDPEVVRARYLDHLTTEEQFVVRKPMAVRAKLDRARQL